MGGESRWQRVSPAESKPDKDLERLTEMGDLRGVEALVREAAQARDNDVLQPLARRRLSVDEALARTGLLPDGPDVRRLLGPLIEDRDRAAALRASCGPAAVPRDAELRERFGQHSTAFRDPTRLPGEERD